MGEAVADPTTNENPIRIANRIFDSLAIEILSWLS
jgi:hypothetical protein